MLESPGAVLAMISFISVRRESHSENAREMIIAAAMP
jgi:hypothetical protein